MKSRSRPVLLTLLALAIATSRAEGQETLFSQVIGDSADWLVFVHGGMTDHLDWGAQTEALCHDFRCLVVDLRGHGRSSGLPGPCDITTMGADVATTMRAAGVGRALLIGHSMGTRVVVEAFHASRDLTAGLIFLDGSALARGDVREAYQAAQDLIASQGMEATWQGLTRGVWRPRDPVLADEIMTRTTSTWHRLGQEVIPNLVAYDAGELDARLADIDVPMLALASTAAARPVPDAAPYGQTKTALPTSTASGPPYPTSRAS